MALRNYVAQRYDLPRNLFSVEFGGENWPGLRKVLEASDYAYRYDVLDIMELSISEDAKEARLKALQGGAPYRELLHDVFPNLRRVDMVVNYDVANFSVEEARNVFRTRPQNLSLNEMFILANFYGQGTSEFNDIMETAARLFPSDDTANLNAAAAALTRGDTQSAAALLDKVNNRTAIYDNNMGVLSLLRDDIGSARMFLQRALNGGVTEASGNLDELERKEANMQQIEKERRWGEF